MGFFKYVRIVSLKVVRESGFFTQSQIESPDDAYKVFRRLLKEEMDRELMAVLCLDTKHRPTALQIVAVGSLDSLIVHPREVFKTAILSNSASIICAHCHPSGDTRPSSEDVNLTFRLLQVGELIGIRLLDHLILGADDFLSMREFSNKDRD